MSLMEATIQRALARRVPLTVHLDLTYRCNERCQHCYLDHLDHGELTTAEVKNLLKQLASAGTFFLTLSGGEILLRQDLGEILAEARSLHFNIKLKTNATLLDRAEAQCLSDFSVEQVQVSIYSHRAEVHDAVTKVRGSFERTVRGIRLLREFGLKVTVANVLMTANACDSEGVQQLAQSLGAHYTLDPTVTPMMDGNPVVLQHRVAAETLHEVFRNPNLVGDVEQFCAVPTAVDEGVLEGLPCSAGHTACYISPYGDVFPCVQFPLLCGNLRRSGFREIWDHSPQFAEVRSIRGRDLQACSSCSHLGTCTRCPGLAYLEGDMRGASSADCEKSFVRTGIPTARMVCDSAQLIPKSRVDLVQIR